MPLLNRRHRPSKPDPCRRSKSGPVTVRSRPLVGERGVVQSLETTLEIGVLARRGKAIRQIARERGIARNTVRKYLRCREIPRYGPRQPRLAKLDALKDYLLERSGNAKRHYWPAQVSQRQVLEYVLSRPQRFRLAHKQKRVRPEMPMGPLCRRSSISRNRDERGAASADRQYMDEFFDVVSDCDKTT